MRSFYQDRLGTNIGKALKTDAFLQEPFVRAGVVQPRFAHEPVVVRAPSTGEWVMFFTGCDPTVREKRLSGAVFILKMIGLPRQALGTSIGKDGEKGVLCAGSQRQPPLLQPGLRSGRRGCQLHSSGRW
jgi:hypothetical protein